MQTVIDTKQVVIASAVRTALGSLGGTLSVVPAIHLGVAVIDEAVRRAGITMRDVDDVIMDNFLERYPREDSKSFLKSALGVEDTTRILITSQVSGFSLMLGVTAILSGADTVVVGGMENPSQSDTRGYWILDAFGELAEFVAQEHNVSHEDARRFIAESRLKTLKAISEGSFQEEIVPVKVPHNHDISSVDEIPSKTSASITNCKTNFSRIAVGAAALVFMSREKVNSLRIEPMGEVVAWGTAESRPSNMVMAPILAVPNVLGQAKLQQSDIDVYEIDEAFPASTVAVIRELGIDPHAVNVHGGSLGLGYPFSASAPRMLTTLLYTMKDANAKTGMLSMSLGGMDALSMVVERH